MSTPALTKTGIADFMTAKINKSKKELEDKIKKMIDELIAETIAHLINYEDIGEKSQVLFDVLEPILEKHNSVFQSGSGIRNLHSNLKYYGVDLKGHMHQTLQYKFTSTVEDPVKHPWTYTVPEVDAAYRQIIKDTRPIKKTLDDLDTLQLEVSRAIKNAGSGKVAYNTLVAMGVNMSEYVEPVRNLPAVIKFSVPVCLVNGDC